MALEKLSSISNKLFWLWSLPQLENLSRLHGWIERAGAHMKRLKIEDPKYGSFKARIFEMFRSRLGHKLDGLKFWKICIGSQNIDKNVSEYDLPNQTFKFWHIFINILGPDAYFSKPIFALKPWGQAGRFEYNEPYNKRKTHKGGPEIFRTKVR